jgi:hypothetical protein
MRLYGHILKINEERILKKVLNMKLKHPRGRPRPRWEQEVMEDITQREGGLQEETERRSCGKIDPETYWSLLSPSK